MSATMFFLVNSLETKRGGLTKASLQQAKTFAEMGYDTFILTFDYNPLYPKIKEELINLGLLEQRVKVLNLYDGLEGYEHRVANEIIPISPEERGCILDKVEGRDAYRVYKDGLYIKYKSYQNDGSLKAIDYFNDQRYRVKTEYYNEFGQVGKVSFMDLELNKPRQMVFYNRDQEAYLSKWVNPKTGKAFRVNWFVEEELRKIYSSDEELKTNWIERIIADFEQPVLVSDSRKTDELMLDVANENAVKILRLHSNHLKPPYEYDSDYAPQVKNALERIDELDAALLLTEQQKEDLYYRCGENQKLRVIPHAISSSSNTIESYSRNPYKAVVISRLDKIKNIDHIIKAFKKVLPVVPQATLEIYGAGSEKAALLQLIKKESLEENIQVKGYTHNANEVYKSAAFSVLASKTEGFSLAVLESMANSTPVISYDIKYGPGEIISDKKDGILVPRDDIEQLAEYMVYLFENPKKALKMGSKAYKKVNKQYSKELYEKKWVNLIEELVESKKVEMTIK